MNIGIVWANPYSRNLGVGALAYSSLAILNDLCKENNIDAKFSLIGSSGRATDTLLINDKNIAVFNIPGNGPLMWKSLLKLVLKFRQHKTLSLLKMDAVFDISEGDSFTDIYGQGRFQRFVYSKMFFNFFKKPQVLLPQTIGPFNTPANEIKAFRVMKNCDLVISRDKQSFEYTSRFLPAEQIMEAIDVAFYMSYKKASFDNNKIHVGINLSGLLWNGGYTRKNQFNMKSDYRSLMEHAIAYFAGMENVTVHFISHVITKRNSTEDDYTVAQEFNKKYPGSVLAPEFKTPIEAKSYISGMDFFFGARMHACIGAFSSGVPVFPMAYSRKFNGLFGETLGYKTMGDCINETDEVILANLKEAFGKRTALKEEIKSINQGVVAERLSGLKKQLLKSILAAGKSR